MSGSPARKVIAFSALIAIIAILVPFSVSCSKPPKPTAAFTVSYVSGELLILEEYIAGTAPLTVRFTDQSSGEITSWKWNFGDGIVIEGSDAEHRNPEHTYTTTNTGFLVVLTVKGPGGEDRHPEQSIVTVFSCSEAANSEFNQAGTAIKNCISAAGRNLDSAVVGWDGRAGMVTAGGFDAANYLDVWTQEDFKATYDVARNGTITSGTDVSWGCVCWDPEGMVGRGGWRAIGLC
jgi:PKD repeat protein